MSIEKFKFNGSEVRTISRDGEPWFVLVDVTNVLELSNPSMLMTTLRESQRAKLNLGRQGEATIINESALYRILLRSRSPKAEPFQIWVEDEVLPSIRKNGMYATDVTIEKMLNDPDFAIGLLNKLKEERQARQYAENKNAILMHVNKTYTATEVAKEAGFKSANAMNKFLHDNKIQYQSNGTWVMYSKYSSLGYESIKQEALDNGRVIYHRRFTQLGRDFILGLVTNDK